MPQLIITNVENKLMDHLYRQAIQHGRSIEEEVLDILRNAVKTDSAQQRGLGSELAQRFQGIGIKIDIPELKGEPLKTWKSQKEK